MHGWGLGALLFYVGFMAGVWYRSSRAENAYIVCPRCGKISYHPRDIAERYCGACHLFHDDEGRTDDKIA